MSYLQYDPWKEIYVRLAASLIVVISVMVLCLSRNL